MKKINVVVILTALLTVLVLAGCQKSDVKDTKPQIPVSQKPYRFNGSEKLAVGTCENIFTELKAKNKNTEDAELYTAASVILFNAKKTEEGSLCCDKIVDQTAKENCKK
jgi:hypothetical protein